MGHDLIRALFLLAARNRFSPYMEDGITKVKRRQNIKIELVKRDWRHRDLAAHLRERGHEIETDEISRLIAGRWNPPEHIRKAISEILDCPTYELFQSEEVA
jgi:hypothetical protein